MIVAVIVLAVVAVLLGGYILLDILYLNKRKTAVATAIEVEIPEEEQPTVIDAKPIVKEVQKPVEFNPDELRESVTAQEVDTLMEDDVAESLIEKSEVKTDRTKQGIINIDTLSQNFKSGEVVTLDEIKKRIKGFSKTTYIKVLARGTLDKALTVEADSFSIQAVKMIVLTGGKVIKNCE
ncbi:MAG: uL15 family ribosomal protein [Clostridia bacterium]|nr:uL15 family ribosomal protein [Clostridia bacterium]